MDKQFLELLEAIALDMSEVHIRADWTFQVDRLKAAIEEQQKKQKLDSTTEIHGGGTGDD